MGGAFKFDSQPDERSKAAQPVAAGPAEIAQSLPNFPLAIAREGPYMPPIRNGQARCGPLFPTSAGRHPGSGCRFWTERA